MTKNRNLTLIVSIFFLVSCITKNKSNIHQRFKNIEIDTTLLFGVWALQPPGADAHFRITQNEFYDVDDFQSSDYSIIGNKINIKDNNNYLNGTILNVSKDSLKIYWKEIDVVLNYWRFHK